MFSMEDLDKIKEKIYQFNIGTAKGNNGDQKEKPGDNKNNTQCGLNLNPAEILAIAGLLSGALEVSSILISRNQNVELTLVGSLRRQTQMEKVMEQIGKFSFEEVMQAILNGIR